MTSAILQKRYKCLLRMFGTRHMRLFLHTRPLYILSHYDHFCKAPPPLLIPSPLFALSLLSPLPAYIPSPNYPQKKKKVKKKEGVCRSEGKAKAILIEIK